MFFACKIYNSELHRRREEGSVGGFGFSAGGAKEIEVCMEGLGWDSIMKHVVNAGEYDAAVMFKDGKIAHEQMLVAIFLHENADYVYLAKRLLDKGRMYVVLPRMISDRDPTTEEKLSCRAKRSEVEAFLRDNL